MSYGTGMKVDVMLTHVCGLRSTLIHNITSCRWNFIDKLNDTGPLDIYSKGGFRHITIPTNSAPNFIEIHTDKHDKLDEACLKIEVVTP